MCGLSPQCIFTCRLRVSPLVNDLQHKAQLKSFSILVVILLWSCLRIFKFFAIAVFFIGVDTVCIFNSWYWSSEVKVLLKIVDSWGLVSWFSSLYSHTCSTVGWSGFGICILLTQKWFRVGNLRLNSKIRFHYFE